MRCKSERQAIYLLRAIKQRFTDCKLAVHGEKTKIVNIRGGSEKNYSMSLDILGFTIEPQYTRVKRGVCRVLPRSVISKQSITSVLAKFNRSINDALASGN